MPAINIHEAKTHFSRLVEAAARGESTVIARAGKPLARVVPFEATPPKLRIGFMAGAISVPADFDTMGGDEIATLFGVGSD